LHGRVRKPVFATVDESQGAVTTEFVKAAICDACVEACPTTAT
jgi:formate hydrogenlyase subunit 6/NADH:ubiquinone oxidoreductase subunit I